MNSSEIKKAVFKHATIFETGGIRPTEELGESWIGKVLWRQEKIEIPSNFEPLCTLFLEKSPYCPKELENYQLITVYMDYDVFNELKSGNLAPFFKINCYTTLDGLHKVNDQSTRIKPFPLIPSLVDNDAPAWDSADFDPEIEGEIVRLESENVSDYHVDIVEEVYPMHKIGGYPSYIQSGVSFGEDYHFVFQISSDEKAQFNIVDSGSFYFFYNETTQEWAVHCDFF